jgi:hypothetical protein
MPWPVLRTSVPRCSPSVGFRQMAPHAAVADLLRDLGGDGDGVALELGVHLDREVDLGQRVGRELDVDDRAGDRDDATVLQRGLGGVGSAVAVIANLLRVGFRAGFEQVGLAGLDGVGEEVVGDELLLRPAQRLAPPTISMISVVMESWRARFMTRLRLMMRSPALSVADFIARWRDACSDAAAFNSAREHARVDVAREQEVEDRVGRRLELVRRGHRALASRVDLVARRAARASGARPPGCPADTKRGVDDLDEVGLLGEERARAASPILGVLVGRLVGEAR